MRLALAAAALVVVAFRVAAPAALADEVVLKNGRTLTGKVVEGTDSVTLECPGMRMTLRKDEVAEVRRAPTAAEELERRRRDIKPADAEARYRLGLWASEKRLAEEARKEYEAAVKADPDHAGARRALGFVRWEGKWRPENEVMAERGFVKVKGAWVPREEAGKAAEAGREASAALADRRERERKAKREVNAALRLLASPDARTRVKGEEALAAFARQSGDQDLEAKAPQFRAYYDRLYAVLEDGARATIEVRAQLVTLKRPIPTFTTSLGGFSSPVRLQLPEVSVVRIGTTVVVPLQIGDDE